MLMNPVSLRIFIHLSLVRSAQKAKEVNVKKPCRFRKGFSMKILPLGCNTLWISISAFDLFISLCKLFSTLCAVTMSNNC